ncbi:type II toxin-antitoxin system RelE family toxin [Neisseria chenwenguii]|uniref:Type II toxin-antitoxin system mRNA interferase toxin, RelE/StbE family n=1 Tax=Neisseria chenwenguii TaxID=1853278 RepID=A0A220S205_9NEIS|nr:type II toxin-antitoxin system RelE/ParE family toxin [Neisseria chenwenguii]ASK27443.1 type II toxin-antitoxin system mRNA interferase toxin, RelE/StbE family [Neisseria chenwenguii]ROV56593.1 type II toxin-antitoxin system RelE/ParE family toxin [Neisseria chenwenguii]
MTYKLAFLPSARAEWDKLDGSVKQVFKKKLAERLETPRVPSAALHNMHDCYKIKLKRAGYRLVYRVDDNIVTITVVSVGRRADLAVYQAAKSRLE